ncbi:hypothetical protein ACFY0R_20480 [Streptomyces sp. NPDC001633]|uniref:hypothetical protein n=1 Tax=Streptomyces sp. NPDC001633 TaxID=3364595 RepID=UPI0036A5B3C6
MVELGILAGAAVGIAGDFLAGVVQNIAAGAVTDLVRQRLRSTDDGTRVLEGLEGAPQDSGRRMEAAGVLADAAQGDSSFTQALSDAVNSYHRETNQGTATSGSPHHQVNISGGGISGKDHQVAGGNIDNSKKRNIRIGMGAFAVLAVGLGGYGITQWVGGSGSESGRSSVAEAGGGLPSGGMSEPEAPASKTLSYDLQRRIQGDDFTHRSRGSLVLTPGTPMSSHPACQLNAPSGTSIVPVTMQLTNTNSSEWEHESGSEYEAETVSVTAEASKGIAAYLHVPEEGPAAEGLRRGACINGGSLASRYEPGGSRTVDLLLWGVPQGKKTEIALKVDASNFEGHKVLKFTVRG